MSAEQIKRLVRKMTPEEMATDLIAIGASLVGVMVPEEWALLTPREQTVNTIGQLRQDVDALTARAEAAELRVKLADAITANNATTAELLARAEAAEAKLAALVQACDSDGVTRTGSNEVRAALRAARGEP